MEVPYIRAFFGGNWGEALEDGSLGRAAQNVMKLRSIAGSEGWTGEFLVETHGIFAASPACEALNARLEIPVAILWDSHHTWRLGRENLDETWDHIGKWVRHIHFKDSVEDPSEPTGYRYVLPGHGGFPAAALIRLLVRAHYTGGVSLEWEKLWHSGIPPLPLALKHFLNIFGKE